MSEEYVTATEDDAEELAAFSSRTFDDAFAAQNEGANFQSYLDSAFSVATTSAELRDPAALTILQRIDGDLVGFARIRSGAEPDCVVAERPLELQRIYVDKRRNVPGLGRRLFEVVHVHAMNEGCDLLWLGVWEENAGAQRFYRRLGLIDIGRQEFMLGNDPQRDVVMALELGSD